MIIYSIKLWLYLITDVIVRYASPPTRAELLLVVMAAADSRFAQGGCQVTRQNCTVYLNQEQTFHCIFCQRIHLAHTATNKLDSL